MINHDVLAFSVASETVQQIRAAAPVWSGIFSVNVFATSSRTWPMPDFVIRDSTNSLSVAGEFKPPDQSKREYLTGLGQAVAYSRDFDYGLLVIPETCAGYRIADHVRDVLAQPELATVPVGLLVYDPAKISPTTAGINVVRPLTKRAAPPTSPVKVDASFWAKWRDMSPTELATFLELLYREGRKTSANGTIRDRAFDKLWRLMTTGRVPHWGGAPRSLNPSHKVAWGKNYRNFVRHVGFTEADGALTPDGFEAMRLAHQYGPGSQLFLDHMARVLLLEGKHLVLINTINEYQDEHYKTTGPFADEPTWLNAVEDHLESEGLLERNPARHAAAVRGSARGFLKAEKTLWRNLGLIVPAGRAGGRVYHAGRGFVFNWTRLSSLVQ